MRWKVCCTLIVIVLMGSALFAQKQRGFVVEEKVQEALEKNAGVRERYALLVGVSKYANPTINLNFAAADAIALQKLLLDPDIGGYKPENVRLLVDDQATRKNVISAMKTWLGNRVKAEDSVIIFYSGHGALGNASEAYWVTYDADVEELDSSALSNKEISAAITALAARRKLTLIDSCYSEATAKKYRALVPSSVFEEFKGEGVVAITASTGQQKSVEVAGHGAFTYHLLDAMSGKADSNSNGVVEIDEIWNYLNEKVQKTAADAGNKQTPVLMAERLEHGFPVTINPGKAAGAVLSNLKKLYAEGAITVDEMGEADRVFSQRDGNPELRRLYRDLGDRTLPVAYFRKVRETAVQGGAATRVQTAALQAPALPAGAPAAVDLSRGQMAPAGAAAAASGPELEAFNISQAMNSLEGWARFLQQFPGGQLAPAARAKFQEMEIKKADMAAYNMAKQSDSEKTWENYVTQFPTGMYIAEAQRRAADLKQQRELELAAYRLAESKNNEAGWERFMKEFPRGQFAAIAEGNLEKLKKLALEKENTMIAAARLSSALADWEQYIKNYPEGRFLAEAMNKRAEVMKRLEEERARKEENDTYLMARNGDTPESWGAYLAKYAAGPHSAEAKTRTEQLKWIAFAETAPVPAGAFMMGSESKGDEKPRHRVELDAFRMGKGEVTNLQYQRFLDETKYRRPADPHFAKNYMATHPELPVVSVPYDDALAFCKWLSQKTGAAVRLPTEAEWEYAALGGKEGLKYPWGSDNPRTKARFNGNDTAIKTVARETYPANGYGLYNMSGNVWEWNSDYYGENGYKTAARKNPPGPPAGRERVLRGGSWDNGEEELMITRRHKQKPEEASDKVGFRVVITGASLNGK